MSGRLLFGFIGLCLSATSCASPIYVDVEPDGTPVFQDTKTPEAQLHEIAPAQTYRARQHVVRVVDDPVQPAVQAEQDYVITILEPQMDAYLTQETEGIGVQIEIQPALLNHHMIEYRLDGQVIQKTTDLYLVLDKQVRGKHTLEVQVVNAAGDRQGEKPASTTFYQYRSFVR